MNIKNDLIVEDDICDFCYDPKYTKEFNKLVSHIYTKNDWVGDYTEEKYKEYSRIYQEFFKNIIKPCLLLNDETGTHICKQCLIELTKII
jgi:hypothetical protein